jgi:hypothetical protein
MTTKRHCDYCDEVVEESTFPCAAEFWYGSTLDTEKIECCSDECFVRELSKRYANNAPEFHDRVLKGPEE